MDNQTILRLAYWPIFLIMFAGGICTGSIIGLTLALINPASISVFGSTFLALLTGLGSGLLGLIYTAVFNTLAPTMGGIVLTIVELPVVVGENSTGLPPDSPAN